MTLENYHTNLLLLRSHEEQIFQQSVGVIFNNPKLSLHIQVVECAMDVLDRLRQYETEDQDLKVIQVLGIRVFNAFASSIKLALSGYNQTGGMILRDILETVFLVDHFRTDRQAIIRWRHADKEQRKKEFSPVKIRISLDERDGAKGQKREELYNLFSEMTAHASMQSIAMLRPKDSDDIIIGPFLDPTSLAASVAEMGRLAVQVGEIFGAFFPKEWEGGRHFFPNLRMEWYETFYPSIAKSARA